MARRIAEGTLGRAVVDDVLAVDRRYTVLEASARTGLAPDLLVRVWLALGFPPPPEDSAVFNDDDLELLSAFMIALDLFGLDAALQFSRVMGSSIARIGEAAVSSFLVNVEGPLLVEGGGELARAQSAAVSAGMALDLPDVFGGLYRRHFQLAVERLRSTQDDKAVGTFRLTVGFCDLVGYTQWSRELSAADLGAAVNAFEQEAHDLITTAGSRVIKSVGDAILFSTPAPEEAAAIALDLTDFVAGHPSLTSLRSGLATGEALGRDGDYYGSVVNLAARVVKEIEPGTVVSDRPIDGFDSRSIGVVELRGVAEPTELFEITRTV
jgi:adenylate cyclase